MTWPVWKPLSGCRKREKACCPFFGLIQNEADSLALQIAVPEDAAWLLGEFTRSASRSGYLRLTRFGGWPGFAGPAVAAAGAGYLASVLKRCKPVLRGDSPRVPPLVEQPWWNPRPSVTVRS